jgi:hypothetical protein
MLTHIYRIVDFLGNCIHIFVYLHIYLASALTDPYFQESFEKNTAPLSQTPAFILWPNAEAEETCAKKTVHRLKSLFSSRPDRSVATATNQPEKVFQPLKSIFFERAPP